MYQASNSNLLFLEEYKEFEDRIVEKLCLDRNDSNIKPVEEFWKIPIYSSYKEKLRKLRQLRNIIAHNTGTESNEYFSINPQAIQQIKEIRNHLDNPPTLLSKMTKKSELLCGSMSSGVIEIMKNMRKNDFSYVPVMSIDSKVIGVFSEASIFNYSADNLLYLIEENDTLEKFSDYINMEKFSDDRFKFISKKNSIFEAYTSITSVSKDAKRVAALFVTENGKSSETLLGMITLWDLLGS